MKRIVMMFLLLILPWVWSSQILSAQTLVYDDSDGPFSILTPTLTLFSPNGGENWNVGTIHNITWNSTGAFTEVNIDYSIDNGSGWLPVVANTANDATYAWTVPSTISPNCLVRIGDGIDGDPTDSSNTIFSISSSDKETVSIPNQPTGPSLGLKNIDYSFSTGASTSNLNHAVQYKFDWDDGSDSGWLAAGTATASHSWAANGTYHILALARCSIDTDIESLWSSALDLTISDHIGYYNSPSNRLILTEVNWSDNWTSEVQITDISGGSSVQAYYNCGTQRYGPFTLWMNSDGAHCSVTFANILQTLDGLDAGAFTYMGTSGALELITQDGNHLIQGAVRTFNGSNSRTFPALADVETNTAASGRQLIIPNISNDISYRCSVVLFNPETENVEVEVRIIGSNGLQIGPTIMRTLVAYQMDVITSEVRAGIYSNANIVIAVTSATGRLLASGQTAHNASDDPAAHLAVQVGSGFANSSGQKKVLTEVSWSTNWISEIQIVDISGGSSVQVSYISGNNRRGPFTLWTNSGGTNCSVNYANILQTIDKLDTEPFEYYGTSGGLEFVTQDASHLIQAAVRTYNGNYSRTFPALGEHDANTAALGRSLLLPNISNNTTYRSSVVLFNPSNASVTVEGKIIGSDGNQIGSTFISTLEAHQMIGYVSEVRADTYSNANILITVTAGSGWVLATGQTAHNVSDDPAGHVAVQAQ